jgi:uncharacterized DUF497 family protein
VFYEWDENKRLSNLKKHGLDFVDAYYVFEDKNAIICSDKRKKHAENRFNIIDEVRNSVVAFICYTNRNNNIRIISFRPASRKERRFYYGNSPICN